MYDLKEAVNFNKSQEKISEHKKQILQEEINGLWKEKEDCKVQDNEETKRPDNRLAFNNCISFQIIKSQREIDNWRKEVTEGMK